MKVYGFRVMLVFVMYYIYVTSGSSLLIESTDSMIMNALVSSLCLYEFRCYAVYSPLSICCLVKNNSK